MIFNYQDISNGLLTQLPQRTRRVLVRRFGLDKDNEKPETLSVIGQDLGITRERVRQIQNAGLKHLVPLAQEHEAAFRFFDNQLKSSGSLRKEDVLLKTLGPETWRNQIFFLLFLDPRFQRALENDSFYTLWWTDHSCWSLGQKIIRALSQRLERAQKPQSLDCLSSWVKADPVLLLASLEASKEINLGPMGLWGLNQWPEINPRAVGDKAYLILEKAKRPLHFRELARLVNEANFFNSKRKVHFQTVHNELIKNPKFVLAGRGIYVLQEWGYSPGTVKEIMIETLERGPLSRKELIKRVLKQRLVQESTVLLNLRNKKVFVQNDQGEYELA